MLRFAICDDNIQVLDRLAKSLENIFIKNNIDANVCLKASTSNEILDYTNKNNVDVLILDINLKSNVSGCDIADIIRKKNKDVYIVFFTGHLEYALIAYKYKTFDYLPKPVSDERLEETIIRLVDDITNKPINFLKLNNSTVIKANDINYIKKDGMKLVFCTSDKNYEIYSSFSKIENQLPKNFVRCHKSYIINVNNISNIKTTDNTVFFDHNNMCSIGSKYKNIFMEVFKNGNFTNNLDSINK